MAIKKESVQAQDVKVPKIETRNAIIHIVGDTPLIVHKWSSKAKKEMLGKQTGAAKTKGHDKKDPVRDFIDSLYWLDHEPEEKNEEGFEKALAEGARFGFPTIAFKAAAVAAGYRAGVTANLVSMRGAFYILGEYAEIHGTPEIREDTVRLGGISRSADLRYRGMFRNWETALTVRYNSGVLTLDQLVNLFNLGGFACGVGEWRMEKGGTFGSFHCE